MAVLRMTRRAREKRTGIIPCTLIIAVIYLGWKATRLQFDEVRKWKVEQAFAIAINAAVPSVDQAPGAYPTEGEHRLAEQLYWNSQRRTEKRRDVIGGITLLLSIIAVSGAIFSAKEGNDQAVAAQGQLTAMRDEQRPMIGAPVITVNKPSSTDLVSYGLTFKNIGKTATTGLYIGANIADADLSEEKARAICEKGLREATTNPKDFTAPSILPGGDFPIGEIPGFVDLDQKVTVVSALKNPRIIGCVVYGSIYSLAPKTTMFWADIRVADSGVTVPNLQAYSWRAE